MGIFDNWKYRILLLALIVLLALYPIMGSLNNGRILYDIILTVAFFASVPAIFADRRLRVAAVVLGIPTLIGIWTGYALGDVPYLPLLIGFHLLATLFFALTVVVLLRGIYRETDVSADGVSGAFCGYLLLGVLFGHIYCLVAATNPSAFNGIEATLHSVRNGGRQHFLLTYFSFTTLTTVGYGDITPASDTARSLAATEAITGQFYLAVLVAELIGKRVSKAM
jgi:voltage-gated potassium channel